MFDEKVKEMGLPVWQSPKYLQTRAFAIDLINSKRYDITEGDFWILMNKSRDGKTMCYTGLIISHNGCLKINDKLENKFNPMCVSLDKNGYGESLVYTYMDDEVYEVGEVSKGNCKNSYPYAMAFKRCFDRVVLKKSKLAFHGVYSDSEAEEFTFPYEREEKAKKEGEAKIKAQTEAPITKDQVDKLMAMIAHIEAEAPLAERVSAICKKYGVAKLEELKPTQFTHCVNMLSQGGVK